jgi:hypothetical protein
MTDCIANYIALLYFWQDDVFKTKILTYLTNFIEVPFFLFSSGCPSHLQINVRYVLSGWEELWIVNYYFTIYLILWIQLQSSLKTFSYYSSPSPSANQFWFCQSESNNLSIVYRILSIMDPADLLLLVNLDSWIQKYIDITCHHFSQFIQNLSYSLFLCIFCENKSTAATRISLQW